MNRGTLPWREVSRRPLRTLLTVLSVAIGVAAIVAVRLASLSATAAFEQLTETVSGKFDLEITSQDAGAFSHEAARKLAGAAGVAEISSVLHRGAKVYAKGKRTQVGVVGIDPADKLALAQYRISSGHGLTIPRSATESNAGPANDAITTPEPMSPPALVEASLARMLGVRTGDRLSLLLPGGPLRTKVVGILEPTGSPAAVVDAGVYLTLDDLGPAARAAGKIDAIRVALAPGTDAAVAASALGRKLGPSFDVRPSLTRRELATETLRGSRYALDFAQAMAVTMALFIVLNTFLISVGERRRQWGLLHALGMTGAQTRTLVLGEAALIGAIGAGVGLALGVWASGYLSRSIATLLEAPPPAATIDIPAIIAAVVLGPLMAMLACYVPARRASSISPMEAMRGDLPALSEGFPRAVVLTALVVWAISTAVIMAALGGRLPALAVIPAGVTMMLGFILMAPPALPIVARWLDRYLVGKVWPAESELGARQVFRNPRRAALTVAVIVVAMADGIGLGHAITNTVDDVRGWYARFLPADLVLTPTDAVTSSAFTITSRDPVDQQLSQLAGVNSVQTVRFANLRAAEHPALLIARSFADAEALPWRDLDAEAAAVREKLAAGDVVLGSVLAARTGMHVGDMLPVRLGAKKTELRIGAIGSDYHGGGMTVTMDRRAAQRTLGVDGVDYFLVSLSADAARAPSAALTTAAQQNNLTIRTFDELRAQLDGLMSGVVAAFWGVLALGMLVAALGVFNTLSMNVLDQTREIGLLRVVGMTARQIRRTIVSQALTLGVLGGLLGTLAGVTTAWIIHLAMGPLLARPVAFVWRPEILVLANVLALVLVLLAAWGPAQRAAHGALAGVP